MDVFAYLQNAAEDVQGDGADEFAMYDTEYIPPTPEYQMGLRNAGDAPPPPPERAVLSAGWIIATPGETRLHPPIFVAHSVSSAIWLLHRSLPEGTLETSQWRKLYCAANGPQGWSQPLVDSDAADTEGEDSTKNGRVSYNRTVTATSQTRRADDASGNEPTGREQRRTTTVTNKNRAAEKRRNTTLDVRRAKRLRQSGILAPPEAAPPSEWAAYEHISVKEETTFAWLIKQPVGKDTDFFHSVKKPYGLARQMMENAACIGNSTALSHARSFLSNWRASGSPLLSSSGVVRTTLSSQLLACTPSSAIHGRGADVTFSQLWSMADRCEFVLAAAHVQYRWTLALLAKKYEEAMQLLEDEDAAYSFPAASRSRAGRGKLRSEAKARLRRELPLGLTPAAFNARLKRSARWYSAVKTLGWGFLCLIPADTVTATWVEQSMLVAQWDLWLQLVDRLKPNVTKAGKALEAFLGADSIAGGPITSSGRLLIEDVGEDLAQHQVMEIADSDDELAEIGGRRAIEDGEGRESASPLSSVSDPDAGARIISVIQLFQVQAAQPL